MSQKAKVEVAEILEATTGGTRRHLFDLATGLDPRRFGVTVFCATRRDQAFLADIAEMRRRGIGVRVVDMVRPVSPARDAAACLRLRRALRGGRFDLVHTHSSKAGGVGRLAARLAGCRRVVHTPHGYAFEMDVPAARRRLYLLLERAASRLTDAVVCVCGTERETALRAGVCPAAKLVVIENGVDPPSAVDKAAVNRLRADLGMRPGDFVVGSVGRLTQQKGHRHLVRAFARVVKAAPCARLVLAGDGELRAELEGLAASLGLAAACLFCGRTSGISSLYGLFDVAALPSLWEAMPYALLDAMAAGRAVVASTVGGCRDAVIEGETGLLVPPADPDALAAALLRLLADREGRERMGDNARRVMRTRFRKADMIRQTEDLYARLVDGAPHPCDTC